MIVRSHRDFAQARYSPGLGLKKEGYLDDADHQLQLARKPDSSQPKVYLAIGEIEASQGKMALAVDTLHKIMLKHIGPSLMF